MGRAAVSLVEARRARERGFTLLEALVALVLIGTMGMALMSWINTGLNSVARVEDVNARNEALQNVLERMQSVNPMMAPTGHAEFGSGPKAYRIDWSSKPLTEVRDAVRFPRGISSFQVALYGVHIAVSSSGEPQWFDLDFKLVGYKQVRVPDAAGVFSQ